MDKDIVKNYVRYLKLQRNMSGNTLDAYQRDLRKLLDYLEGAEKSATKLKMQRSMCGARRAAMRANVSLWRSMV